MNEDSELENAEELDGDETEGGESLSVTSPSENKENTSQSRPRNKQLSQRKKRPNPTEEIVEIMKKKFGTKNPEALPKT